MTKPDASQSRAMALAYHCVRNSPLEDLHGGIFPSSKTGDYSDVKVVTPYGDIPWNEVSRISDEEMKALMIRITDALYTGLIDPDLMFGDHSPPPYWNIPKRVDFPD